MMTQCTLVITKRKVVFAKIQVRSSSLVIISKCIGDSLYQQIGFPNKSMLHTKKTKKNSVL